MQTNQQLRKETKLAYNKLLSIKLLHFFEEKNRMAFCKFGSFQGKAFRKGLLASDKRARESKSVGAALITQQRQTVEIAKLQISIKYLAIQ